MRSTRKSSGSMLVLILFLLGILVVFALAAFTVNNFLFFRSRAQHQTDSIALSLASKINKNDRVGQMNEFAAHSRELIYSSRERLSDCNTEDLELLRPIAEQLLHEAREGHTLLERERRNLVSQICKEVKESALEQNASLSGMSVFNMGALLTEQAQIERVELGSIKNIASNVKAETVFEKLREFDTTSDHFHKKNGLFRADIDAKLPEFDSDLSFKISSLPANVKGTCSQARNVNPDAFVGKGILIDKSTGQPCQLDFAPTAVQVYSKFPASLGLRNKYHADMTFVSSAATNGALKVD